MYGSSGYEKRPSGGVVENFLYRAEVGGKGTEHIKSIVDPKKTLKFITPHSAVYRRGYKCYSLNGNEVWGATNNFSEYGDIRLNHYFTNSLEEWIKRRSYGMASVEDKRSIDEFYAYDNNDVYDASALEKFKEKSADHCPVL